MITAVALIRPTFVLFQIKRVYDIIPSNSGVRGRVPRVLKVPPWHPEPASANFAS